MADQRGRNLCTRRDLIPRQMYQVAIQATIGGRMLRGDHQGIPEGCDCQMLW